MTCRRAWHFKILGYKVEVDNFTHFSAIQNLAFNGVPATNFKVEKVLFIFHE
jgi:hypothetical protein